MHSRATHVIGLHLGQQAARPESGRARRWFGGTLLSALLLFFSLPSAPAGGAEPIVVISIASGGGTEICDTDCTVCTVASGECIFVIEEDLIMCKPLSTGLPITSCDWEPLLDGQATGIQLDKQMRSAEMAENGNIVFSTLNDNALPALSGLTKFDLALFVPSDKFGPYVGGGPYDGGNFKLYLNGDLTQQATTTRPWDSVEVLPDGSCEDNITDDNDDHTCHIIGSNTGTSGSSGLGGVHPKNEDLFRCIPTGWAGNGAVEACQYDLFLDASNINADTYGVNEGVKSDIEAVDFLGFDASTMTGQMVFKKGSGNPPGFPSHTPSKDLLLYDGTFGAGNCVPSGNPCAGDLDCPLGESCFTGTCTLAPFDPCANEDDCNGSGNECDIARYPAGTVTMYFDGVAVGLSGAGQKIEAFTIIPDDDGDGIPDGLDNCPGVDNPPDLCSDGVTPCPSGLSSECPETFFCEQPDTDGDGVGDPCDQCNGRDDAVCYCGDFIVDVPSEQCDLGDPALDGFNGEPGSPCSGDCMIFGVCTGTTAAACTEGADCPGFGGGEGCCGNGVVDDVDGPGGVEPDEECDDGNSIDDDECHNDCTINAGGTPIVGCGDLTGPQVVPAFVKITKFINTSRFPDFDKWKTKGDFNLITGLAIDPVADDVRITYNNSLSGVLFSHTLPPGNSVLKVDKPRRQKWKFLDREADVPGAGSWRKGKFIQKGNKVKFVLDGRVTEENGLGPLFALADAGDAGSDPTGPVVRQSILIGDVCATLLLDVPACEVKGNGKTLKCKPLN